MQSPNIQAENELVMMGRLLDIWLYVSYPVGILSTFKILCDKISVE